MDMGYDVMWVPVLEEWWVDKVGWVDGWTGGWWAGLACGWEERELRRVLLVWRKESMSMVVSAAREGFFLHLDLEGFSRSCFVFVG
jgi:hypothetical protein